MKRNKLFIAGIVTVFVALLSLTLVSSTLAKYTSQVSGTDTATVAKWKWNYTGTNVSETEKFDLFNTIIDTDTDAEEEDVKANLIAPGTKGSFTFSLQNLSDVNATYSVTFSSELVGGTGYLPIKFTLKQGSTELASDYDLSAFNTKIQNVAADMNSAAQQYTVEWEWVFESGNDTADTNLGELAAAGEVKYQVAILVTMTQVD